MTAAPVPGGPVPAAPPAPPADARRQAFLAGMRAAAHAVTVVTTDGPAGRFGVTVSAMASVSADGPAPLLLVCIHHQSPAAAAIAANGRFCVNLLAAEQRAVSEYFAGRVQHPNGRFACADWDIGQTGAPVLRAAAAAFDCTVEDSLPKGSHLVLFGAVQEVRTSPFAALPLLYCHQAYGYPTPLVEP